MKVTALVLSLMLGATLALAAEEKITVRVRHTGEDGVGQIVAYSIREEIRKSSAYRLCETTFCQFEIAIVSLAPRSEGDSSAIAVVFLADNMTWFGLAQQGVIPKESVQRYSRHPDFVSSLHLGSQVFLVESASTLQATAIIMASFDSHATKRLQGIAEFRAAAAMAR